MQFLTGLWGNTYVKAGAVFLGGVVAGALISRAFCRGSLSFRPLAAGACCKGIDVKDAVKEAEGCGNGAQEVAAEAQQVQA